MEGEWSAVSGVKKNPNILNNEERMAHLLFPATDYFKFRPKVPKYQGEG